LYGEPRLTKDIDVTISLDSGQLNVLLPIIDMLHVELITEKVEDFVKRTSVMPVRDAKTGIRIDFIFSFTSYERQAIGHARKLRIGNTDVAFATVEDLIIHKLFSGRPRDIEDVKSILRKNRDHDTDYVCKWLKDFDESLRMNTLGKYRQILSEEDDA